MLIECSECKNQISDKAEFCPHCGSPVVFVNTENYCDINGIRYDLSNIVDILPKVGYDDNEVHPYYIIGMIRDRTPLEPDASSKLANIILETRKIPAKFSGTIEIKQINNLPKCPTCGATNVEKIGGLERGASVGMWGLFSKKINKTFKCKNCGYTW